MVKPPKYSCGFLLLSKAPFFNMMSLSDIQEGTDCIEFSARLCKNSLDNMLKGTNDQIKFISKLVKWGHDSILEHVSETILFFCSRCCSHQFVRHRMASYKQVSQRSTTFVWPKLLPLKDDLAIYMQLPMIIPPELFDQIIGSLSLSHFISNNFSVLVIPFFRRIGNSTVLNVNFRIMEQPSKQSVWERLFKQACLGMSTEKHIFTMSQLYYVEKSSEEKNIKIENIPQALYRMCKVRISGSENAGFSVLYNIVGSIIKTLEWAVIDSDNSLRKEDLRYFYPQCIGTALLVTANLREWKHILKLRADKFAQWEIRHLAEGVKSVFMKDYPFLFADEEEQQ